VYCTVVGDQLEDCDVLLHVSTETSRAGAVRWWYRVADALRRRRAPFTHDDGLFRWQGVHLYGRSTRPGWAPVGWRCPEDERLSEDEITARMSARAPLEPAGFATAAAARRAGCRIAVYPTRHETLVPWR
jgi:hypothetical protein